MELANKFNKAEADKRAGGHKWREYNFVGAVRMHHLPRHASRQSSRSVRGRQRADFAAWQRPCRRTARRREKEEEDDDERRGKSGALKGRKLFSSFLSLLGEDVAK